MEEGHFDIKIIPSRPEDEAYCRWLEPIAAKLLESFLNCWNQQILSGKPCIHNPSHEDIHIRGGQGIN